MMKRLFDIIFSILGISLFSPVFLLVALWIKLDSKGPIFYSQCRIGRFGNTFKLLKFRSMYLDSDLSGLLTVGGRDPRITSAGFYIRKYKIDELPQLINVFKGEMSIVGPRPEVKKYVDLYTAEQKKVLHLRPGISDLASIKYSNENELLDKQTDPEAYYINVILQDKLKLNLEYVQKQSLFFDVKIIISTIFKVSFQ